MTAQGTWVRDKEFGLQFKSEMLTSTPPTTIEGIEKYLGSGMVKGIGPVYAKKLVSRFKESIFKVIEYRSADLESVDGIGPKRRRKIKDAWAEQKVIRQIIVFLHSHGVSTSRSVRIYKTYGEEAVEKVRGNPYGLARDIHGIGFKTADQIAQKVGIPHDSILRAAAGLSHVLLEATNAGQCALPLERLLEEAGQLLLVSDEITKTALAKSLADGELTQENIADTELVFVPALRRAEQNIAARIRNLAILKILRAKHVECLLCAPTGRAAKRLGDATGLGASTIHRLLEVQPGARFGRNETNPLNCDLLVADLC